MLKDRLLVEIKETIYSRMPEAVGAGEDHMQSYPDMRFQFVTNATGGLEQYPSGSAADLMKAVDNAAGGMSFSMANEALMYLEQSALEMGREVTRSKNGLSYLTTISPVMK